MCGCLCPVDSYWNSPALNHHTSPCPRFTPRVTASLRLPQVMQDGGNAHDAVCLAAYIALANTT